MQTRRRLFAVLAATATAAALAAGCSSSGSTSPASNAPLPDAATLLTQSVTTTKGETSVHLGLTTQGQDILKALPVTKLAGDLTNVPAVAAQGSASIVFLGQTLADVPFAVLDGNLYAALTPGGAEKLIGPAADVYDVSVILNPNVGLANVLGSFTSPKADNRESVNGVSTVRVTGMVAADAVNKIAPDLDATAPVPGTAWIREDGDHDLVQAELDTSPGNSIQMTLSDWGKPVTVTKPA
jgi:lipoprotein LprG